MSDAMMSDDELVTISMLTTLTLITMMTTYFDSVD